MPKLGLPKRKLSLPSHLGGGTFLREGTSPTARDISTEKKEEIRGGNFQDTLSEVNHIISVALGGTRDPNNLNSLKSDLNFTGKFKRLFGLNINIDDLKNRQQGRVKVEQDIIGQVNKGDISREEGIVKLKGFDFLQEAKPTALDIGKDTFKQFIKIGIDFAKQVGKSQPFGYTTQDVKKVEQGIKKFFGIDTTPKFIGGDELPEPTPEHLLSLGLGPINYDNLTDESKEFIKKQIFLKPNAIQVSVVEAGRPAIEQAGAILRQTVEEGRIQQKIAFGDIPGITQEQKTQAQRDIATNTVFAGGTRSVFLVGEKQATQLFLKAIGKKLGKRVNKQEADLLKKTLDKTGKVEFSTPSQKYKLTKQGKQIRVEVSEIGKQLEKGVAPTKPIIQKLTLPKGFVPKQPLTALKVPKIAPEAVKKGISKELQPLAQEARKFKTAEEFIGTQRKGQLFHGTGDVVDNLEAISDDVGILWTAQKADIAEGFIPDVRKSIFINPEDLKRIGDQPLIKGNANVPDNIFSDKELVNLLDIDIIKTTDGVATKQSANEIFNKIESIGGIFNKDTGKFVFGKGKDVGEGSLFGLKLKGDEKLKIKDLRRDTGLFGEEVADTNRLKDFEQAKKEGFDGVKIKDFNTTSDGKTELFDSIGLFDSGINKLKQEKVKTKSQLTDFFNQAKGEVKPVKTKIKTGKEQLAERKTAKLEREKGISTRESLVFPDFELEEQFQAFKKLVPPSKLDEIEDVAQLKKKVKADPNEIDNILFSQEKTDNEIFDMFKERRFKETESLTKIPKETKAVVAERARETVKSDKDILQRRRSFIRAVQKQFGLSDADLKTITKRDIRLMSNIEFKKFLDDLKIKAEKLAEKLQAKNELVQQINDKDLKNVESLRRAMKLPPVNKMTTDDLNKLSEALVPFQKGDVFLGQRKLETVDRTELTGIKTWREAREAFAKKVGIKPEDLNNIKVSELDRFRWDSPLARRNPFYNLMVDLNTRRMLTAEKEYLDIEKKTFALAKKAKQKGIVQKFIPQQKNLRAYLEGGDVKLNESELDLANFMADEFEKARDYLVETEAMKFGRDNYFVHIRRNILETVKEDGFIKSVKEAFTQYKQIEQSFEVLDRQTGEILALDKFFKFALRRTGEIVPTENVIKSFLTYMRIFKTKQSLDEMVPLIDIYAHSLTPKEMSEKGLLLHGNLITFVKEWLNTQKGRHVTIFAKQGGKIDGVLRAIKMFTSLRDLGINIPVSFATEIGEQVTTYQLLGKKQFTIGKVRQNTKQGKKIIEQHRELVGKNPWKELVEPAKNAGERLMEGIFIMFRDATVRANKTFLLGSLSREEFRTGVITPEHLTAMKRELGRYRQVEGVKSIIGATPEGKSYTQYKSWAIPILDTTVNNLKNLTKVLSKDPKNKTLSKRALNEFYRLIEIVSFVFTIHYVIGGDDEDGFVGKMKSKAYREAYTLIQAIQPKLYLTAGRTVAFLEELGENLALLIKLERYKESEKLKGLQKLIKQFKPVAISQFEGEDFFRKKAKLPTPKLKIDGKLKLPSGKDKLKLKSSDQKIKLP